MAKNVARHSNRIPTEEIEDPRFSSTEDLVKFFDRNPDKLMDYVETGVSRDVSIFGVYIAQLANKVGHPLKADDKTYETLSSKAPIKPSRFDNIELILKTARAMFSPPVLGRSNRASTR